jgi:hypothetical protein
MDIQETPRDEQTDARLREIFRKNAPPADEAHLAAALRPEAALASGTATTRAPKRPARRRRLRVIAVTAGAVVLAAAIGIGSWQAAARLGGSDSVVVITDHPTSTGQSTATDLRAQLTDGTWEFQPDRQADLQNIKLPSEQLSEKDYHAVAGAPAFAVTISDGGEKVSLKGTLGSEQFAAEGKRFSVEDQSVTYDLDAFAGGRFVIWFTYEGLRAEFTVYGSGVPMIASYRGTFAKAGSQSFDDLWRASTAAVSVLGPARVTITQTVTVKALDENGQLPSTEEGTFVTTVEELFDPASQRARLKVQPADGHLLTTIVSGLDELQIDAELAASSMAPATRTVRAEVPDGLPLPLWAGDPGLGYPDLVSVGSPSDERVIIPSDGGAKQLSWKQTWGGTYGTYTVTLTLGSGNLPARIDITGEGKVAGTKVQRTTLIEYQYDMGVAFADPDFSMDLPSSAALSAWTYESPLDHPYSQKADWGQYWLGPDMGDWSLKGAQLEILSGGRDSVAPEQFISLTYRRAGAGSPAEQLQVLVAPPDARMTTDARQLGQQEVDLGVWTKQETTVTGKSATVYMGPAEPSKIGGIDSVYVFLPDAFIDVDLWDLADPQMVLDAIQGLSADTTVDPDAAAAEAATKGAPDLLASYTTVYEGSTARQVNVKVATQYASGVLLKPGQEYDFDTQVGPRTRERGFSIPVGSLTAGTTVEDAILGGSLTQVATTLFNAAFHAGLDITERHNSSIYIAHYPQGRDASIAAGSKNLRFVNDTEHDLWIVGTSDGVTTRFSIFGTDDSRKVQSSKGDFYNIVPKTTVTVPDETLPKGETATTNGGQDGRTLEVRRTVTLPDGTVLHDDVFTSVWPMYPEEMRVGTSTE